MTRLGGKKGRSLKIFVSYGGVPVTTVGAPSASLARGGKFYRDCTYLCREKKGSRNQRGARTFRLGRRKRADEIRW